MNINLADNLKRLRKQRKMTQEDLADFIGVSFQAVSKWERKEGYPDITLLPVIASFFGVTLDELVGMNDIRNEGKRRKLIENAILLASQGKITETISTLREGLRLFPNDYEIMADLAAYLDGAGTSDDERKKNQLEAIRISEHILEYCTDAEIRNNVQANMCFLLWRNGEAKKAIEAAQNLPNLYKTMDFTLPRFLAGDEKVTFCQEVIQKLCWGFWWLIKLLVNEPHYTDDDKIRLLQKAEAIYQIVYEKEDYGFAHVRLADLHEKISVLLFQNDRVDEAFEYLEKSATHCAAYDQLSDDYQHTSLLVNSLIFNKTNTSKNIEANSSRELLEHIFHDEENVYKQHWKDDRMKHLIEKLEMQTK